MRRVSVVQRAPAASHPPAHGPFGGGYQVLAPAPGHGFHARSEAGFEVRLTPRTEALPVPPIGALHPHVTEVLAVRDELIISAWVPGLCLVELLERARAAGLATLPPFVAVRLVQQLALGLQHAHAHGGHLPGVVDGVGVVAGFDGVVRVACYGQPAHDVSALADVLVSLLAAPDDELQQLINSARRGELAEALTFERRLGHWLVKQHQSFPRHDLVAELICWLCPTETKRTTAPEVAAWFVEQRNGPLEHPAAPTTTRVRPAVLLGVVALLVVLGLVGWSTRDELNEPPVPAPLRSLPSVQRPVVTTQRPEALTENAPTLLKAPPGLPRASSGVPATIALSSAVHGLALERAGFEVQAPGPRWAARTIAMGHRPLPPYAALFAAEFDETGKLGRLRQTTVGWTHFEARRARFFVVETGQSPSEGPFGFEVAREENARFEAVEGLRRPFGLNDARTDVEYTRYVLSGLNPRAFYTVLLNKNAAGATPAVVASATLHASTAYLFKMEGFQVAATPPAQVLLQPGVQVTVAGASRLAFVVPTTTGAPELTATVQVFPVIPITRGTGPR